MKVILKQKKIPAIWFWTWQINDKNTIFEAIKIWYRHIDTAQIYKNEKQVWEAIKKAISTKILNSYEDIFVTSKLWVSKFNKYSMNSNDIFNSINTSCKKIGQKYIDLMLIHWPTYHDIKIIIDGMILAKNKGIIKNIWVSNFDIEQLKEVNSYIQTRHKENITCNQIEFNLYYEDKNLISFCQKNNILVSAYSPLWSKSEYHPKDITYIWEDITLKKLSKKYKKSPQQIILKYLSQKWNIAILPSSKNKQHIIDNLNINSFFLEKKDIDILNNYPKDISIMYLKYKDKIYKS